MIRRTYAKFGAALLVIIIVFMFCTGTVFAEDDKKDQTGTLFENLDQIESAGSYIEYRDNYTLDLEDVSLLSEPGAHVFNWLDNGIFALIKTIGTLCASLTKYALDADIYTMVSDFITPFFSAMEKLFFTPYARYFIAIAVFVLLLSMVRNRHSEAIGGLISTAVIVAVAIFFYTQPMTVLSGISGLTKDIGGTVMDAPFSTVTGEDGTKYSAADKSAILTWNVVVHKPWELMEFGQTKDVKQHEDTILQHDEGSDERVDYIEDMETKGLMKGSTGAQIQRLGIALVFLLFSIAILIVIGGMTLLIIGYQFFVIFLSLLGTIIFLLALIPRWGHQVLKNWGMKLIMAAGTNIVLMFFLAVMFVIMDFLYAASDNYGLTPVLFAIIAMITIIVAKRQELVDIFQQTNAGKFTNQAKDGANQTLSDMSNIRSMFNRNGSDGETEPDEHLQTNVENIRIAPNDISDLDKSDYRKATDLLQQNYDASRLKTETEAERMGIEPQYTDFVKRTDAIRAMGGDSQFDDRDIAKTSRVISRTEAAGGSVDDLVGDPDERNSGEVKRPNKILSDDQDDDAEHATVRENVVEIETENPETKASYSGINYFRENFGEEQGEKMYEKLENKYGKEKVDSFSSNEKLSRAEIVGKLRKDGEQ